jgi:CubicO group peptidase (beta-lactamase class C family)
MRTLKIKLISASLLAIATSLSGCAPQQSVGVSRGAAAPPRHGAAARPLQADSAPAAVPVAVAPPSLPAPPAPAAPADAPELPRLAPATDLDEIDAAVEAAIARRDTPGAVVVVVREGGVVFDRAYGVRSKEPAEEPMTVDTVFDLGSLTKALATAPAIMLLAQQGKLSLSNPVSKFSPEFGQRGKEGITIAQLLLHTSGLIPDNHLRDYEGGPARALGRIAALDPFHAPGSKFDYSDVGFIVLGSLVERISGEPFDDFVKKHLYEPLGMRDTTFKLGEELLSRTAPTAQRDGHFLKGEVHDMRAALLGGVAGHAGLFTSALDVARFAVMVMNGGELGGVRVLDAATVEQMTAPRTLPAGGGLRSFGWDINTSFSSNRGSLPGGLGHTGFTGTSIWIVPARKTAVIILSNRLHPDGKGGSGKLRREVANVVAKSLAK